MPPPGMDLSVVSDTLKVLSSIGQLVPVAGEAISGALELGSQICEIVQDVKDNRHALHQLAINTGVSLVEITKIIQTADEVRRPEYEDHVGELYIVMKEIKETASSMNKRGLWSRALGRSKAKQTIADLDCQLGKACARFGVYEALRSKISMDGLRNTTDSIMNFQRETLLAVKRAQITAERTAESVLLEKLNPVAYGWDSDVVSTSTSCCLADTRVRLLADIENWARVDLRNPSPAIFWLSGLAGTGKSTIARTLCERFTAQRMLCASFFFSRQSAERRDPSRVACSLAFQISLGDESLRAAICKAIQDNLDVATRSIADQIRLLLTQPLQACAPPKRALMIVIDALDESDTREGKAGGALLPALAAVVRGLRTFPAVQLFVTSRSDASIRVMFNELKRDAPHQLVQLHEIEHSIVREDIMRYLEYTLRAIPNKIPDVLPGGWPEQADLVALAARAGVLFVYAATLVRFIDSELDDPVRQLRSILDDTLAESDAAYGVVDDLYLQILDRAVKSQADANHPHCRRLRDIVGSLILVREPMSADCLAALIGIQLADVTLLLRQLTAVLIVPEFGPVIVFHPSFPDFITDSRRCRAERFRVHTSTWHTVLARRCLILMNEHLRRNMCCIENPSLLNSEVPDLLERIQEAAPPELLYACQYWGSHLSLAVPNDTILCAELVKFAGGRLLYWIEALSLMGILHVSYSVLDIARNYINHDPSSTETATLLNDANHLLREFYPAIREAALHVYYSAVPLMSKCRLLELCEQEADSAVRLVSERHEGWHEELLQTVQSGGSRADLLVFLPGGVRVLCAVKTLKQSITHIWDISTGEVVLCIYRQIDDAIIKTVTVAVSPDGRRMASSSPVDHPQIWSTETGEKLLELRYSDNVEDLGGQFYTTPTYLKFSSDGQRVVGSGGTSIVHLWDAESGDLEATFGDALWVDYLGFSDDGDRIICANEDRTAHIWDVKTRKLMSKVDRLYTSFALLMSPTTYKIAAVINYENSTDLGCKLRSAHGETLELVYLNKSGYFSGPNGRQPTRSYFAFSREGELLCAREHGHDTLHMWDLRTGTLLGTLEKPDNPGIFVSLFMSDDSSLIAVGSRQGIIYLWNAHTRKLTAQLSGHSEEVDIVSISSRLTSHSSDGSVRIWNISDIRQIQKTAQAKKDLVHISISDDGNKIVSVSQLCLNGSEKCTMTVWNTAASGRAEITIAPVAGTNDFEYIPCVAICADGSRIISECHGHPPYTYVWETATGQRIATLAGGSQTVTLSADGEIAGTIQQGNLRVWDVCKAEIRSTIQIRPIYHGYVYPVFSAVLSPDGKHVAVYSRRDGGIQVFNTISGQSIASLKCSIPGASHYRSNLSLKYSSNLRLSLYLCDLTDSVRTWNTTQNYEPAADDPSFIYISDPDRSSYWIWCTWSGTQRKAFRVCWVPPERHPNIYGAFKNRDCESSLRGNIMVIGNGGEDLTILDLTASQRWVTGGRDSVANLSRGDTESEM